MAAGSQQQVRQRPKPDGVTAKKTHSYTQYSGILRVIMVCEDNHRRQLKRCFLRQNYKTNNIKVENLK